MEQIFGYIERITFDNAETGYVVAQLKMPKFKDLICIVGYLPQLQPGETVRCFGAWKMHLIHGKQFEVSKFQREAPSDLEGIKKYLGSGLIKGIGPKYADRITAYFDIETLSIIDQQPDRLYEVPGLGKKKVEKIKKCWSEQKSIRDVMIFLQKYGVSPAYAQKIFKKYGQESVKKVKENPYQLSKDVYGIGFKLADKIAAEMGILKESDQRIDAGVEFVLTQLASEGHVCFPLADYVKKAEEQLEITGQHIENRLEHLQKEDRIEVFDLIKQGQSTPFIWHKPYFFSEIGISREICRLKKEACALRTIQVDKALEWVQTKLNIQLAQNQQQAVAAALSEKCLIITGGPGTGKSTITKAILAITEKLSNRIVLAAPTGRAAKRMGEITLKKASTIHSLLELDFTNGGFKRNKDNPIECDLIIVDEASMIDTMLMYSLLKAIPNHARLILVGDVNQLPSVGPGNVLRDFINSMVIPVITLNEIFRQAAGSRIITNAHRINKGLYPDTRNLSDTDFFFFETNEPQDILRNVLALASQKLPKKYGFDPLREIQILAPMRRGLIGIDNLNQVLQETLNPNKEALFRAGRKFKLGDKVMQIRNDYKREVFNGDIGYILDIDQDEQQVLVKIDDRDVIYEYSDLDELVLAYAVSVHKYQGSECKAVILPVHSSYFNLDRNLLYTAVTRGKNIVVMVGTKKALAIAVKSVENKVRYTGLQEALMGTMQL